MDTRPEPWRGLQRRHAVVGALAWGLLALIDTALSRVEALSEVPTALAALGLGTLSGGLLGLLWGGTVALLRPRPRWLRVGVWLLAGLAVFGWLAVQLGALERLVGPYAKLAMVALAACALGGLASGLLLALFQPGPGESSGWLPRRRLRVRLPIALGFAAGATAAAWTDRTQFPGTYDEAHAALRLAAVLAVGLALHLLRPGPWTPAPRWRLLLTALAGLALAAAPFALIRGERSPRAASLAEPPFARMALLATRSLLDFDRDGHPNALGDTDCAPWNGAIGPEAAEIPGNGVDDNCLAGDGRGRTAPDPAAVAVPSAPASTSVVLITVDTLRPDRMSAYGYKRDTTPELTRWAKGARRYDAAYAAGGWTTISLPALLRGLYPRRLSWVRMALTNLQRQYRLADPQGFQMKAGEKLIAQFLLPLGEPNRPLPWWLQRRGMRTMAVTDSGFTEILEGRWGFGEGFDLYRETQNEGRLPRDDESTTALALELLRGVPDGQPFFLWIHYFGPHAASTRHAGIPDFGWLEPDQYDHEIRFLDSALKPLLDELGRRAAVAPVATILTADHGERFYNTRMRGHGRDLTEDSIRVPLFIQGPGFAPGKSDELVSGVDLMPTVLALTGTPAPPGLDGRNLAARVPKGRVIFVDTFTRSAENTDKLDLNAALDAKQKLIFDRLDGTLTLVPRRPGRVRPSDKDPADAAPALYKAQAEYIDDCGGPPAIVE